MGGWDGDGRRGDVPPTMIKSYVWGLDMVGCRTRNEFCYKKEGKVELHIYVHGDY